MTKVNFFSPARQPLTRSKQITPLLVIRAEIELDDRIYC